jgi:glycosyltransferase involved in cell wall biosynthesis
MELIVGDDASMDETRTVVESFHDPRIRYIRHEKNVGIYANWNKLVELCSGDYVCIYHDHDNYEDTILERLAELLDEHQNMSFAHTAHTLIDAQGNLVGIDVRDFPSVMQGSELRLRIANHWYAPVVAATAMVRRAAYLKAGPYEASKYGLACDKHMWFRLAAGGTVGYVPEPQAHIRVRESNGATSIFSWDNVLLSQLMRRDEIAEVYAANQVEGRKAVRRMNRDIDRQLLVLATRCLLLDPPEVWLAEENSVISQMGITARLAYRFIRSSRLIRSFLKAIVRPLHYKRIARKAAIEQRHAKDYASQHPRIRV